MNYVSLIGRTTKDIELRYTPQSQIACTKFSLAVDRPKRKDKEQETDFITCQAWKATAELIDKYVHKGDRIAVQGRIITGSYEKDGKKVYTTEVLVENVEFLEPKKTEPKKEEIPEGFAMINDDSFPF